MPDLDFHAMARERVGRRRKEPEHDPSWAALVAGVLAATGLVIFCAIAGLNAEDFNAASLIVILLAAGGTYLHYRQVERRYYDEVHRERERLEAEHRNI